MDRLIYQRRKGHSHRKPEEGYTFTGWTGAVVSDSDTVTVTADKAVSLVCTFKKTEYEKGDINTDGKTDVADLLLISRYLHGTADFTKTNYKKADMNGDDSVDVFDMILLRKKLI